jgi:hypothetical protein
MYVHQRFIDFYSKHCEFFEKEVFARVCLLRSLDQSKNVKWLPSDYCCFVINNPRPKDAMWIERTFRNSRLTDLDSSLDSFIYCYLSVVSKSTIIRDGQSKKRIITLQDDDLNEIDLVLVDTQVALSRFFKKGDSLAIYRPYFFQNTQDDPICMEYGYSTVFIVIPNKQVQLIIFNNLG